MIACNQVIEIIKGQFPDMKISCDKSKIMQGFECISSYAKEQLDAGNDAKFKELIDFVEKFYYLGDGNAKTGIDNVLLYNIGSYIDCSCEAHHIREILPHRMRSVLTKQYGASAL